ncbi:MAG TPA: hypothetical protein VFV72_14525 [Candidatus Limnocylindrales bacterium]|nr:hypothetical protein [Candidatus Limnocylindrales bacterium]
MHRTVSTLLSTKSPGRLAKLGNALGARRIDIATTGGAEWKHSGPVTLMIKDDWGAEPKNDLRAFADVMAKEELPWLIFRTVAVELRDEPGSLGAAATALDDINVYAVNVLSTDGNHAVVGLGVRPSQVATAIERLSAAGYRVHRAHHPHEPVEDDDSWWDEWDDRTERLIGLFDDDDVSPSDPRFYELT